MSSFFRPVVESPNSVNRAFKSFTVILDQVDEVSSISTVAAGLVSNVVSSCSAATFPSAADCRRSISSLLTPEVLSDRLERRSLSSFTVSFSRLLGSGPSEVVFVGVSCGSSSTAACDNSLRWEFIQFR